MQELRSLSWAARSCKMRSRNNPYIPNQNPIRAAAHRYRIMLARFRSVRQEKRQAKIRRAVPVSQPAAQENRITAAMHRDGRCRAESAQQRSTFVQPPDTQRGAPNGIAPNAMPNNPVSPSATPRSPAQPVGSAGMPNHPNGSQVRNTQAESVQQRSTFVQAPNMAGAQPAADHPASPASPRSGMAGNPSVPHSSTPPIPAQNGVTGKQPDSHSMHPPAIPQELVRGHSNRQSAEYASARYGRNAAHVHRRTLYPARAADDARFHEWKHPDHAAEPCFCPAVRRHGAAVQRSPYGWPLHKSGAFCACSAGISGSAVFQPRSWYAPRSTARPDAARPAEQHASQRPIPAQRRQRRKADTADWHTSFSCFRRFFRTAEQETGCPSCYGQHDCAGSGIAGIARPQRSPAAESSAKRPVPQERRVGTQPESQKKEQTLYHRPGTAGIAPTAVGINTEAASAAQKPAAEKAAKKPFVPLTGRTPESIPSHLDLHEASQKTTKRPQENTQEVASDE